MRVLDFVDEMIEYKWQRPMEQFEPKKKRQHFKLETLGNRK